MIERLQCIKIGKIWRDSTTEDAEVTEVFPTNLASFHRISPAGEGLSSEPSVTSVVNCFA
jgi:hypothetical protein